MPTQSATESVSSRSILHGVKTPYDVIFERALGTRLWDVDGKEYRDLVSGTMGTAMIGHSHPAVVKAVTEQVAQMASNLYFFDNAPMARFADKMAEIAPPGLDRTLLCPGGGEGVETAIKLAMRATGRTEVLSLTGAYHGMSLATMGLGGMSKLRSWMPGATRWPNFSQIPHPHEFQRTQNISEDEAVAAGLSALRAALTGGSYKQVAAVVVEISQGPNGHITAPPSYFQEMQEICAEHDVLVIVDEVQTGLGRCGSMWASDVVGLRPDILVIGKCFGGGVPFGGVIARGDLIEEEVEKQGWHYLTFMNQPLQAAAGLAVVGVVEDENLVQRAADLGERSRAFLQRRAEQYATLTDIHGPGLFLTVEFRDGGDDQLAAQACREAYYNGIENGVITYLGGKGNILKFKPALTISDNECDELLDMFDTILAFADKRVLELGGRPKAQTH